MTSEDIENYFTSLGPDMDLLRLAGYSKPELIKELIENRGAKVNAMNDRGSTPLHKAAKGEFGEISAKIIEYLISKGADINAKDNKGITPLHEAAKSEFKEILVIKTLINCGADINAQDSKGQTPLDIATVSYPECEIELLKHGANINTDNPLIVQAVIMANNDKAIDLATRIQNINNLEKACSKLEIRDREETLNILQKAKTRLIESIPADCVKSLKEGSLKDKEKLLEMFQSLKEKSSYIDLGIKILKAESSPFDDYKYKDTYEGIPVKEWFASEDPYVDLRTFVGTSDLPLVAYGIENLKLDTNHFKKPTLLELALAQDTKESIEVARYLLKKGVDVNVKNDNGFNLFDVAIVRGNEEHIKLFIPYTPDFNIITSEKLTKDQKALCVSNLMNAAYFGFGDIDISMQIKYLSALGFYYDHLEVNQSYINELDKRLEVLTDWFSYTVRQKDEDDYKDIKEKLKDLSLLEFSEEALEEADEISFLKDKLSQDKDPIIQMVLTKFKGTFWDLLDSKMVGEINSCLSFSELLQVALVGTLEMKAGGEEKDTQEI